MSNKNPEDRPFTSMYSDVFRNMCIELNYAEFKIYYYLLSLSSCKNIHPSYADIAKKTRVLERTVRRSVKSLKKKGFLSYKSGNGAGVSNEYQLYSEHIFIPIKKIEENPKLKDHKNIVISEYRGNQ